MHRISFWPYLNYHLAGTPVQKASRSGYSNLAVACRGPWTGPIDVFARIQTIVTSTGITTTTKVAMFVTTRALAMARSTEQTLRTATNTELWLKLVTAPTESQLSLHGGNFLRYGAGAPLPVTCLSALTTAGLQSGHVMSTNILQSKT